MAELEAPGAWRPLDGIVLSDVRVEHELAWRTEIFRGRWLRSRACGLCPRANPTIPAKILPSALQSWRQMSIIGQSRTDTLLQRSTSTKSISQSGSLSAAMIAAVAEHGHDLSTLFSELL